VRSGRVTANPEVTPKRALCPDWGRSDPNLQVRPSWDLETHLSLFTSIDAQAPDSRGPGADAENIEFDNELLVSGKKQLNP